MKGYKLVPVEPTAEMINAGQDQEFTVDVYAAMLASAPPQPTYDEEKERELFSKWAFRVVGHGPYGDVHEMDSFDADYSEMEQVWLARAKAVEVGDE